MAKNHFIKLIGYRWDPKKDVSPAIVNATSHIIQPVRSGRSILSFWALDSIISSGCRYYIGKDFGKWRERLPYTVHLYAPDTYWWEDASMAKAPLISSHIFFTGGESAGLERLVKNSKGFARFLDPKMMISDMINNMADIGYKHQEDGFWQAQSIFCNIIQKLSAGIRVDNDTFDLSSPRHSSNKLLSEKIDRFLHKNYQGRLTLAMLSRQFHVSQSTLTHRYHKETGQSLISGLIRLRIEKAKRLLMQGKKLTVIAEATGFDDIYHLSKTFKKMTGTSPRQFIQCLQLRRQGP